MHIAYEMAMYPYFIWPPGCSIYGDDDGDGDTMCDVSGDSWLQFSDGKGSTLRRIFTVISACILIVHSARPCPRLKAHEPSLDHHRARSDELSAEK